MHITKENKSKIEELIKKITKKLEDDPHAYKVKTISKHYMYKIVDALPYDIPTTLATLDITIYLDTLLSKGRLELRFGNLTCFLDKDKAITKFVSVLTDVALIQEKEKRSKLEKQANERLERVLDSHV